MAPTVTIVPLRQKRFCKRWECNFSTYKLPIVAGELHQFSLFGAVRMRLLSLGILCSLASLASGVLSGSAGLHVQV